jgi:hypothetical protein
MTEPKSSPTKPHNPTQVDYGSIVTQLQKAQRIRRQQIIQASGPFTTVASIYEYYAVAVKGVRQSGATRYLLNRFLTDPEHTVLITATQVDAAELNLGIVKLAEQRKKKANPNGRVFCARDVLTTVNQYGPSPNEQDRMVLRVTLDPNDHNPAATMVGIHEEYVRRLEEIRTKTIHPTNPLARVKTVLVQHIERCESQGLNFSRILRFARLGEQLPEFILLD